MKIQFRLPKFDDDSHAALIERGWIPLREPTNLVVAILLSIPLMVIAVLISVGIISPDFHYWNASYNESSISWIQSS